MLFYNDPESMIRGYKAGFSFNVKGGDAKPKLRIRSANNWVRTLLPDVYVDAKLAKENDSIGETLKRF
jgi:excinuclease UvrABC ATPase subunit